MHSHAEKRLRGEKKNAWGGGYVGQSRESRPQLGFHQRFAHGANALDARSMGHTGSSSCPASLVCAWCTRGRSRRCGYGHVDLAVYPLASYVASRIAACCPLRVPSPTWPTTYPSSVSFIWCCSGSSWPLLLDIFVACVRLHFITSWILKLDSHAEADRLSFVGVLRAGVVAGDGLIKEFRKAWNLLRCCFPSHTLDSSVSSPVWNGVLSLPLGRLQVVVLRSTEY